MLPLATNWNIYIQCWIYIIKLFYNQWKLKNIYISNIIKFKCLYYKFYQLRGLIVLKYLWFEKNI